MAKPGEQYQQIVKALVQALDPNATVRVGQWIHGPDGEREVDVEIRACVDGKSHFTLVECKDWRRPVDIQEVDKLVSKSEDLGADLALLYSNSGFTGKAIRKASRVGIELASALERGNAAIPFSLHYHALGKLIELPPAEAYLRINVREQATIPPITSLSTLSFDGLPIACWAQEEINSAVKCEEQGGSVVIDYWFSSPPPLAVDDTPISAIGLVLVAKWRVKWLSQIINAEATQASFDHIRKRTTLPGSASLTFGPIDTYSSGWTELPERPEEWSCPPPRSGVSLKFGFLKGFVPPYEPQEVPSLDRYVRKREVKRGGLSEIRSLPGAALR